MDNKTVFKFEAGTSREETLEYLEDIKPQLLEKISIDGFNELKEEYEKNFRIICDNCQTVLKKNNTFTCRFCTVKYDLCIDCCYFIATTQCPEGYGCNKTESLEKADKSEKANEIFLVKKKRDALQSYEVFGNTFYVPPIKVIDMEMSKFVNDIKACTHAVRYATLINQGNNQKYISPDFLRDMWLYFRSTDEDCLERFGFPLTSITDLGDSNIIGIYKKFKMHFKQFISLYNNDAPLLLRMIYPNGNEFVIRKLYCDEQREVCEKLKCKNFPFVTKFFDMSSYNTDKRRLDIKEHMELEMARKLEEMSEEGQVLLIVISTCL